jgi:hypothetical protein
VPECGLGFVSMSNAGHDGIPSTAPFCDGRFKPTAFFGLRVIEVASAAAVAWQFSGADPEARGRAACSR